MPRSRKKKKIFSKRFMTHKGAYAVVALALVVLAAGFYVLRGGAFARENPWEGEYFHGYFDGAWATVHSGAYTGNDPVVVVKGQWGPEPSSSPWQIVAIVTTNSTYVEYLGFSCNGFSTCRPSSLTPPDAYFPNENYDLKVCINVPAGYASDGTGKDLFTMYYRYLQPPPHLWFRVEFFTAPGTCDANPSASGARVRNGHGNCSPQIYAGPGQVREEQCNFNGPGDGLGKGFGTGFSPAAQGLGSGPTGPSTSPSLGAGGGGGSAVNVQSNQPNPLPESSDQGDASQQPEVEPSPFFDGKLFAAGSNASDTASVNLGGLRLAYGWVYLGAAIALLGVGGFFGWRYRQTLHSILSKVSVKR